jgi:hypothetical protein
VWEFDVCKHARLLTDDSYAFTSAVRAIQFDMQRQLSPFVNGAQSPAPSVGGGGSAAAAAPGDREAQLQLRARWEGAIMSALQAVCEKHKFAWAKVPVSQVRD